MSRKHHQKAVSPHRGEVVKLTQALYLNGRAVQEGPKKRTWSRHDLKHIKPLTIAQEDLFRAFMEGQNIVAHGSAGTGKSFVGLYLALNEYFRMESEIDKIIIVRSAVPTRQLGFMPGDINEKTALYETPYRDIVGDLFGKHSTYDDMKEAGIIQFMTTSFIRGVTWDNAIVIIDEAQDCNAHELNSIMTRLGESSRIIVCGDTKQNDLMYSKHDVSGLATFLQAVAKMSCMTTVQFTHNDIVRSQFVKDWIIAYEQVVQ